jgi:hypothetical protein
VGGTTVVRSIEKASVIGIYIQIWIPWRIPVVVGTAVVGSMKKPFVI